MHVRPTDVQQTVDLAAGYLELPHHRLRVDRKPVDDLGPALHAYLHVVSPQRQSLRPAAAARQVTALDPDTHTRTLGVPLAPPANQRPNRRVSGDAPHPLPWPAPRLGIAAKASDQTRPTHHSLSAPLTLRLYPNPRS